VRVGRRCFCDVCGRGRAAVPGESVCPHRCPAGHELRVGTGPGGGAINTRNNAPISWFPHLMLRPKSSNQLSYQKSCHQNSLIDELLRSPHPFLSPPRCQCNAMQCRAKLQSCAYQNINIQNALIRPTSSICMHFLLLSYRYLQFGFLKSRLD